MDIETFQQLTGGTGKKSSKLKSGNSELKHPPTSIFGNFFGVYSLTNMRQIYPQHIMLDLDLWTKSWC